MMNNNTNSHNTERYSLVARKQFGWIITYGNRMRKIFRKPIMSAETGGKGFRKSCDVRKRSENIGEPRKRLLRDSVIVNHSFPKNKMQINLDTMPWDLAEKYIIDPSNTSINTVVDSKNFNVLGAHFPNVTC